MIQNKKELWERTVIKVQEVTNNNGVENTPPLIYFI